MVTRRQLFDVLYEKDKLQRSSRTEYLFKYLVRHYKIENDADAMLKMRIFTSKFCNVVYAKLDQCGRKTDRFVKNNTAWLSVCVFEETGLEIDPNAEPQPGTSSGGRRGRPSKEFSASSVRSKRRKTSKLSSTFETEELTLAARRKLKTEGKDDAAKLVSEALLTPTRAGKIRTAWQKTQKSKKIIPLTPDEALSVMIESKDTKHSYLVHRRIAKEHFADIYPSYHKLREAKLRCYPRKEGQTVSESCAEILLQDLLDHTVKRIVELQKPVLRSLSTELLKNLKLLLKWGCDGSTGHSQYKQLFSDNSFGDGDLFLTSIVPLQLYAEQPGQDKIIVWQNPRPSSTRFCRPIRFQFKKETKELTVQETSYIENQISELQPTIGMLDSEEIAVSHVCVMTMIDGKVCNAITETASSQTCYICKATPKQMNDIEKLLKREVVQENLKFGLSTLHAWIRFFECLLHISYRLEVKVWQIRGSNNRAVFENKKRTIQQIFRDRTGLLVDIPKSGGSGTTNDGNTARRFFADPSLSSEITGIDKDVIMRFGIILRTLSCGYAIDVRAFEEYCLETAKLYVAKYSWYYMPSSVHKILLHGAIVIKEAILPIGQLSEEAQESRNKDLKSFREKHTRKISRISGNQDLLNRLLITSDPVISSLRQYPLRKSSNISSEVVSLLKAPSLESMEADSLRALQLNMESRQVSSSDEEDDSASDVDF
ncbi:uncharacterized protein LOC126891809 [Diabrotica virgifera virgifera]|uniref:Uncharacterized protein LOC114325225 n=3 Tax=Diabrotica virgifera virgifera TaxID=50390 RepID=A0A6P7F0D1_DIAVI|nr:uncharacterized protein LOC114339585 [Diabrotica virgifera virgifera]XP_050502473.1 uncharacterized protein LOC126881866 [Diabrotica virgifera virgifera]XP_050506410.1 uncharacterized protein LOC126884514 [Diabrotica virgifera virgifera]XP_050511495.1 uncharacterized protein LOC126887750 [Diabrotica virgifera virgifera]XP_050512006.1 uncharacterized protein LOC126888038 [Diabrotica virgifera virgifera]XP_050512054.1 uncharacterized protein LOC126888075 [Diabrotica virgifera virgifera]XP_05